LRPADGSRSFARRAAIAIDDASLDRCEALVESAFGAIGDAATEDAAPGGSSLARWSSRKRCFTGLDPPVGSAEARAP
jgi:hypothetical protein